MFLGLHFFGSDNPFYDSFFINQESSAESTHVSTSVQFLFSPYSKLFHLPFVIVGNQGKRKIVLFDKFLVRLFIVYADTDYFIAGFT